MPGKRALSFLMNKKIGVSISAVDRSFKGIGASAHTAGAAPLDLGDIYHRDLSIQVSRMLLRLELPSGAEGFIGSRGSAARLQARR